MEWPGQNPGWWTFWIKLKVWQSLCEVMTTSSQGLYQHIDFPATLKISVCKKTPSRPHTEMKIKLHHRNGCCSWHLILQLSTQCRSLLVIAGFDLRLCVVRTSFPLLCVLVSLPTSLPVTPVGVIHLFWVCNVLRYILSVPGGSQGVYVANCFLVCTGETE